MKPLDIPYGVIGIASSFSFIGLDFGPYSDEEPKLITSSKLLHFERLLKSFIVLIIFT